jgi:hypothetical protein
MSTKYPIKKLHFPNGEYYGETLNNVPHGKGIFTFLSSSRYASGTYEGDFQYGVRHGTGTLTFENGETYIGQFSNDKQHGKGILHLPNGDSYDGDFVKGNKQGYGVYTYAKGGRYEGEYSNNLRNGKGIYYLSDDTVFFEGEFIDGGIANKPDTGFGKLVGADGQRYVGEIVNNIPEGKGLFFFPDGSTYSGETIHGVPNGTGTSRYPNGIAYVGEYINGEKHGQGEETFPDGLLKIGEKYLIKRNGSYMYDELHGNGTEYYSDGSKCNGNFHMGQFHGRIVFTDTKGISNWVDYENGKVVNTEAMEKASREIQILKNKAAASQTSNNTKVSKEYRELLPKAISGNAKAAHRIAVLLALGDGIQQNLDKALSWMKKSANLGDADAKEKIPTYQRYRDTKITRKQIEDEWLQESLKILKGGSVMSNSIVGRWERFESGYSFYYKFNSDLTYETDEIPGRDIMCGPYSFDGRRVTVTDNAGEVGVSFNVSVSGDSLTVYFDSGDNVQYRRS